MVSFRITKNGFIGNGSGSLTGSLLGTASHAITASSVAWNDVTEKPSTYPAAAHDHTEDHLKPASVTTTGDITVGGNLIVNGSQTVIKTENLTVKDKLIEIASGSTTKATIDGAGIQFGEASLNASIKYENSGSTGAFVSPIDIHAPNIDLSITSISALYRNLGSATQPIYLTTAGPKAAKKYSEAEVKSAGFATSAEKLSTGNVGGTGEPVYFENGIPVADAKTKGVVDWVTINSESLLTPDEVIWKKGTGIDSIVQVIAGGTSLPTATGKRAIATGYGTTALGGASHAEGRYTTASGNYSHAEGNACQASGQGSHAEGNHTTSSGKYSHAEGGFTTASGEYSHTEGSGSIALGTGSHAEGFYTTASGDYSHAEGQMTVASGNYSHAEGQMTVASGDYSHAEGIFVHALGYGSHAEGRYTTASGMYSHAEGYRTTASGDYSHAEGYCTTASGECSHAEGYFTITSNQYEHAQGLYNYSSPNQIFSVGAGEKISAASTKRRNAISVLAVDNGGGHTASFFVQNVGGYDGTNPHPGTNDLATVISKLKPNAGTVTSVGVSAGTGITASVTNATTTPKISISSAQAHTHDNKAVLDGITAAKTASWTSKQDAITDLATIRSNADNGQTAYGWGNHASKGYAKSGDITTAINNLVKESGSKWSTDTKVTSADNHYKPAQAGTSGSSTARYYIKTIGVDSKGHVTSVTTGHETVVNTDTKVTAVGNHYTPEQSTAKAASAGSVISGIGLDAKGHVTSITSSNSISNATNATIATNLGVVGNTSASVAKAIAEKWTYNEDTIKGVIVNKAVSATKLVGTSGSEGVPVYIDAGVPKACQANLVSLPLSSTGATSGNVTLVPGKVHNCGELTENLILDLDKSSTDSHEAIYCCVFNMGSPLKTIALPEGVKVVENSADLDTTNVYYEINIMNNVAIIARTAAS